ncbi:F-box only protein 21-like isoform X2 [Linepithema humile]|uniref:F-box only protein 21-like isoform X2 n=1 Tax=Linepithema humile TaxID=83485 RepID=UPI00351F62EA
MATIMDLPHEVISIILCEESVSIKDIVSFALTCKGFNKIINDNVLWRKKFYQRWSLLREEYDDELLYYKKDIDFLEEVKADPDKGAYFMNYYFFVNELLEQSSMESDMKYHADTLLFYLHFYGIKNKWHKFVNYCKVERILENTVTILAQCDQSHRSQEYMSYMHVRTSLDNIAQQVLEYLKNKYPAHPIFLVSAEQFSFWKYNNIDDNYWNGIEASQILESLCKVLQNKLGFYFNSKKCEGPGESLTSLHCFMHDLENECNTEISLAIIFHCVARRLGVRCDLVSFPFRFLCWRSKFRTTNLKDEECFYIDVLHFKSRQSINDGSMIISATKMHPIKLKFLRDEFQFEKKRRFWSGLVRVFDDSYE